jgi:hypothetical protein
VIFVGHVVVPSETGLHQVWCFTKVQQQSSTGMLGFWSLLHQLSSERGVELALEWFNSFLDSSISASANYADIWPSENANYLGSFVRAKIFGHHKHGWIFLLFVEGQVELQAWQYSLRTCVYVVSSVGIIRYQQMHNKS